MFLEKKKEKMKQRMAVLLVISLILTLVPGVSLAQSSTDVPETKYYELYFIKNTPLYNKMGEKKSWSSVAEQSTPVPVIERKGEWFSFQYGSNIRWVKLSDQTTYVRAIPEKIGEDKASPQKYMYLHHPITAYKEASPNSERVMNLTPQRIEVTKVNNGWYEIVTQRGPAWIYDGSGYVTTSQGTKKIKITKSVKLYQYPSTHSKVVAELTNTPFETTAYASTGNWYQIDSNGEYYWVFAANGEVEVLKTQFTEKYTAQNGNAGNAMFLTVPKSVERWNGLHNYTKQEQIEILEKRLVTDHNGKKVRLFDTFITRPINHQFESNVSYIHYISSADGNFADFKPFFDDIFGKDKDLQLLDAAAKSAQAKLNDQQKINVIIGIPHFLVKQPQDPVKKLTFNDEQLAQFAGKYIEEVKKRWAQLNPQHLTLAGFYFVREDVPNEYAAQVRLVAEQVHLHGFKFYWAPHFGAANAERWESLGFDFAWLQPNYYFEKDRKNHPNTDMLGISYTLARETGAGTMLEWNSQFAIDEHAKLVEEYITRGLKMGANRPSILVYDSEGNFDSLFHTTTIKRLNELKPKIFNYLLQYRGKNEAVAYKKPITANTIAVYVNGYLKQFAQNPIIQDQQVYVPLRPIAEYFGYAVGWDSTAKVITVTKSSTKITLQVGTDQVMKNGTAVPLGQKIVSINNNTMVPLDFVTKVMEVKGEWNANTNSIHLEYSVNK